MGKPAVTALGWQSGICLGSVFEKAHLRIGDLHVAAPSFLLRVNADRSRVGVS